MQKCGIGTADQQMLGSIASECWYLELDDPENLPIGGSRIGGDPDLPASLHWPDGESEPMSFLLQIRLEDIEPALPHGMPRSGMLYFFVDDDENSLHVKHKLLWGGDLSCLSRRKPQGRTPETEQRHGIAGACSLKVIHGVDLPIHDNLPLKLYQEDSGFEMLQNLENLLRGGGDREAVCGKLFGSFSVQNPVLKNVAALFLGRDTELSAKAHFGELFEIVTTNEQAASVDPSLLDHEMQRWTRLLWLDSNFEVGFNIWDAGSYSVLMRVEDIATHDFERSHVMLETC
jgi:uncharacterized protein YwqG